MIDGFGEAFDFGREALRFFLANFAQESDLPLQEAVRSQSKRQSLLIESFKNADGPIHLLEAQLLEFLGEFAVTVNDPQINLQSFLVILDIQSLDLLYVPL